MFQTQESSGGSYTSTIYGFIRDQKYEEAVRILQIELENHAHSRAALSLLGARPSWRTRMVQLGVAL